MLPNRNRGVRGPGLATLPTTGPGIRLQNIGGKVILSGDVGRRARPRRLPWTMTGVVESGTAKIRVGVGMVNNFVPTIGGVSLAAVTPPTLTVTGASGQVYLDATVDGAGAITALIIASASSVPTDTSTQKRKLIGTWTASGGAFTSVVSILDRNQTYYRCGGTPIWES